MKKHIILRVMAMFVVMVSLALPACGNETSGQQITSTGAGTTVQNEQTEPVETRREVTIVGEKMRHMNYNIAGSNTLERIPNFDLNEAKRNNIKAYIEELDPDTFGIQEAPQAWIEGLPGLLDGKYAMVGGYSDEIGKNEKFWYNPIYYKVDTFNCLDSGVLFLDEGFKYHKNNRNCAFALLERIADGELVLVLSHHMEHRVLGSEDLKTLNYTTYYEMTADRNILRDHQVSYLAQIVSSKLEQYASYGKEITVVISGDFNINRWQDDEFEHEYTRLCETLGAVGMYDSVAITENVIPNQTRKEWQTYRDTFDVKYPYACLDYVFVSGNVVVDSFTVFNTPHDMGESSDHHPVYADYYIGH